MLSYLRSGAIPGIGQVLSGRLVREFGENVFLIARADPEKFLEVKGLAPKTVKALQLAAEAFNAKLLEGE